MQFTCRVAAFTAGRTAASARFRVRQYIDALRSHDVHVTEYASRFGSYPPVSSIARPFWAATTLANRLPGIVASHGYDLSLIQREMVSTFATLERFTKRPRVLDVDDAIWVNRGGRAARALARACDSVVCGNEYLASKFRQWNPSVIVIPTAVNTSRFKPKPELREPSLRIGWSGSSEAFAELYAIEEALATILHRHLNVKLLVMSNGKPTFKNIPASRVEMVSWSRGVEVETLQRMDIGLMPLRDSDWNRGKCSYKLLLYMACGVASVASPVGMNCQVLSCGACGLAASTARDWHQALEKLITEPSFRGDISREGRRVVQSNFSLEHVVPRIANHFLGAARPNGMIRPLSAEMPPHA